MDGLTKIFDPNDTALNRYWIIEPFLKHHVSLAQIARDKRISIRTLQRWVEAFRRAGLNALSPRTRKDKGQHRDVCNELSETIQGLFLRSPGVPISAIHRSLQDICEKNGWRIPSYDVVHEIVSAIRPSLRTLAHEGAKSYKQNFGLIHRFEAEGPNDVWQADHTSLDILILDSNKRPVRPWLTAIVDDYSRAVPGYFLGFQPPSSMRIALALRQAIWRKDDPNWTICGIPDKFYSDSVPRNRICIMCPD